MDMKNFFFLDSKLLSSTVQMTATGLGCNEFGINDEWNLILGKYKGITFPITFKQESGKKLTDILDTGWPGLYLISNHLKAILEKFNLTGWKTYSILLWDKNENEIPGYHGFSVTGTCGEISYKSSEIIEKRRVPDGPLCRFYKGLSIKDNWDGSDFFTSVDLYRTIVTKKVVKTLNENMITNVEFKSFTEVETSERHVKGII